MHMPSYPPRKQSKIISACMTLHHFIRESRLEDKDFHGCDEDENFIPTVDEPSELRRRRQRLRRANEQVGEDMGDDRDMNKFRDWMANGLYERRMA
jgi:hypothetical protein